MVLGVAGPCPHTMTEFLQIPSAASGFYFRIRRIFAGPSAPVLFALPGLCQIVVGAVAAATAAPKKAPGPTANPHAAARSRYRNNRRLLRSRRHHRPLGIPKGNQGPRQLLPRQQE